MTVGTGGLKPGGAVTVKVTCAADLSDLSKTRMPGTVQLHGDAVSPVDTYRSRALGFGNSECSWAGTGGLEVLDVGVNAVTRPFRRLRPVLRSLREGGRDDRGQVVVAVAGGVVVLWLFAGIVIDGGLALAAAARAQDVAQEAARTGAQQVDVHRLRNGTVRLRTAQAKPTRDATPPPAATTPP